MADAFLHALGKERVLVEVDRAIATKLLEFVRRFKPVSYTHLRAHET